MDNDPSASTGGAEGAARPPVLALVRDLLFASKIAAAAESRGGRVRVVRDPLRLGTEPGRRLLVDLNLDGAIDAAAAWQRATGGETVGFVSHTDAATIARARAAGITRVMARSQFVERLAELV